MGTLPRTLLRNVLLLLACAGSLAGQTPEQNRAAFEAAAQLTQTSYHWDSLGGTPPVPQVATTPRTPLGYAPSLTSLTWDPSRPDLYQTRTIGSVEYPCTLVGTFTRAYPMWTAPSGTVTTLSYDVGTTTHYILPWVTSGNDLKSYLQENYFPTGEVPGPDSVALRIQQSVGLPASDAQNSGLAFFWVPLQNLARPAYSADIGVPVAGLGTHPDGTFRTTSTGAPVGFQYVDGSDNTKTYPSLQDYVTWNQAETTYPWTAMGYTFNWNALQDGNPLYGNDPLHVTSPIGPAEFIVSGGSTVVLESWVPYSQLGSWVVPEPGVWGLLLLGAACGVTVRRMGIR